MATVIGTTTNSAPLSHSRATLNATPSSTPTYVIHFNSGTVSLNGVSAEQSVWGTSEATLVSNAGNKAVPGNPNATKTVMITGINGMLVAPNAGNTTFVDDTYAVATNAWTQQSPTGGPAISSSNSPVFHGFHVVSGGTGYWHIVAGCTATAQMVHYAAASEGGGLTIGRTATFTTANNSAQAPIRIVPWNGKVLMLCVDGAATNNIQGDATDSLLSSAPSATSGTATVCFSAVGGISTTGSMAALNDKSDGSGNVWMAYQASAGLSVVTLASNAAGIANSNWSSALVLQNPDGSTTSTADKWPTFLGDDTGNMWLFWVQNSTNAVMVQQLTYSGGPSAVGSSSTVVSSITGTNSRQHLTTQGYDATQAVLVYKEGTVSPFNVVAHFYTLPATSTDPFPVGYDVLPYALNVNAAYRM